MKRNTLLLTFLLQVLACSDTSHATPHEQNQADKCNSEGSDASCQYLDNTQTIDDQKNTLNENALNNDDEDTEWKDVLIYPDGRIYSGGVVNGQQEGLGREETPAGDRYDGEWEGGIKSGAGKYKWKDGRSYKGEFRENVPNGMGTLKTPDGASYIGMWVDGSKHGRGRYRWPSGKVYEGDWKDGLQHGYGKLYAPPPSATEGGLGGKHVGTNGHVGDVLYEGQFYEGSPLNDINIGNDK